MLALVYPENGTVRLIFSQKRRDMKPNEEEKQIWELKAEENVEGLLEPSTIEGQDGDSIEVYECETFDTNSSLVTFENEPNLVSKRVVHFLGSDQGFMKRNITLDEDLKTHNISVHAKIPVNESLHIIIKCNEKIDYQYDVDSTSNEYQWHDSGEWKPKKSCVLNITIRSEVFVDQIKNPTQREL